MRRVLCLILFALALAAPPARAQDGGALSNQVAYSYGDGDTGHTLGGASLRSQVVDPRGTVSGCDGTPLPSYQGFHIGLYEPDPSDPTGTGARAAVALTPTFAPAAPGQAQGAAPNTANANPFALAEGGRGRFSLLLDPARGQTEPGRVYILVLSPPPGSPYRTRRVRITLGEPDAGTPAPARVPYTAASLDGAPISGMGGAMAAPYALTAMPGRAGAGALLALSLSLTDCPTRELQISKVGDRATAEPGDTVVYRVTVANTTTLPLGGLEILDTPPRGFDLRPDSPRAGVGAARVPVTSAPAGPSVRFSFGALVLPPGQTLTLAYALLLTPDALRGDGRNSAVVSASALLTMNGTTMTSPVSDGPAAFTLGVRQGLLTDTGTLVGRVWIDRSRDGEQQDGEPGLPGAVVLLDDSTRIVADARGLFSLAAVPSGYHSAVLDMQSVPGYVLARGRFRERRSQSRLVRVSPGGMVRLNFGVVPAPAGPAAKGGAR